MSSLEMHPALRPALLRFAEKMEMKLRKHDHDRGVEGWLNSHPNDLIEAIFVELLEVGKALTNRDDPVRRFLAEHLGETIYYGTFSKKRAAAAELVDVANFCMMLADLLTREGS